MKNSAWLLMGSEKVAASIEVRWPSGVLQVLGKAHADQILKLEEPHYDALPRTKQAPRFWWWVSFEMRLPQRLYFNPLPQGQGSCLPIFRVNSESGSSSRKRAPKSKPRR
jgi:hypothetical protein